MMMPEVSHRTYNNNYYDFGNHVIEVTKSVVNRTIEIAKRLFNSIGQFICGFCMGAMFTTGFFIFTPACYALDFATLAILIASGGLFLGIGMAVDSWKSHYTVKLVSAAPRANGSFDVS